jgi:hypothetical protein
LIDNAIATAGRRADQVAAERAQAIRSGGADLATTATQTAGGATAVEARFIAVLHVVITGWHRALAAGADTALAITCLSAELGV